MLQLSFWSKAAAGLRAGAVAAGQVVVPATASLALLLAAAACQVMPAETQPTTQPSR